MITPDTTTAAALTAPTLTLSPTVQRVLNRLVTKAVDAGGVWLIGKGWLAEGRAPALTELLTGVLVIVIGNALTWAWSHWYQGLLLKTSPATQATVADVVAQVRDAIEKQTAELLAAPTPAPVVPVIKLDHAATAQALGTQMVAAAQPLIDAAAKTAVSNLLKWQLPSETVPLPPKAPQ